MSNKRAFTLMELLVVVLIVAVLAAVALPYYNHAVYKSRYSSLMPMARVAANGNEVYYLHHGAYTKNLNLLDITQNTTTAAGQLTPVADANFAYILASRNDLPNNNYIVYQKHSSNFPGEIHCEALNKDETANWLCKEALHGELFSTHARTKGYVTYILQGTGNGSLLTPMDTVALACEQTANCSVSWNEDETEVATTQCSADGLLCTKITYDEDGDKVDWAETECKTQLTSDGSCAVATTRGTYEVTKNEKGQVTASKKCGYVNNQQQCYEIWTYPTYDEKWNKPTTTHTRVCNGWDAEAQCISYDLSKANRDEEERFDPVTGKRIFLKQKECGTMDFSTGICTSYRKTTIQTYDSSGTKISGVECKGAKLDSKTGECKE